MTDQLNLREKLARIDLTLLDIEQRTEEVRQMKNIDADTKLEQLRQLKRYEPWKLVLAGVTAGAALLGAGAAIGALTITLLFHLVR